MASLLALPGCGGCSKDPAKAQQELEKKLAEERARKKRKKKKKPNFEPFELTARPGGGESGRSLYKPGHWTAVSLRAKANNFDFLGDLRLAVNDRAGDRVPLQYTRFDMTTTRQLALPKGQLKRFESLLFVPAVRDNVNVSCRLHERKSGSRAWGSIPNLARMPSYQYYLVVLARWPQSYSYLGKLPSVTPPTDTWSTLPTGPYYLVSLMPAERRVELPSHGLLWTSIACVVWDDREPDALEPDQQQALLDWLHWGGQLIVSGPETLDTLRDSFLAPYLPATAAGAFELGAMNFQPLHDWASRNKPVPPLRLQEPLAGIRLNKHPEARFLPGSGELIAERRLGRGRIAVTAFGLSSRKLTQWKGFDEVFNAFLLRHPRRRFTEKEDAGLQVDWADPGRHRLDAGYVSNLRFFTRDAGVTMEGYGSDVRKTEEMDLYSDLVPSPSPGVAAWNDVGPIAVEARETLLRAAQIEIPDSGFVVWAVAGYLLVLVPLNWAVFRLIGRVEWAWVAAPLIAVVCTLAVIRMAQLDIGFARARTEIAVVELQGDYPRAHVTRYNALYTSLTTSYGLQFEDPGSLVLPFPKDLEKKSSSNRRHVVFRHDKQTDLHDYYVRSNVTGMVHSEQVVEVGGGLSLTENDDGGFQVTNGTALSLKEVGVVRRNGAGRLRSAWIGSLQPGATAPLYWRPALDNPGKGRWWSKQRDGSELLGPTAAPGELTLRELADQAQATDRLPRGDFRKLQPGQARLVGVVEGSLPGPRIDPAAPQSQQATLLIAHLDHGAGEDPQPDLNTKDKPKKK